jgi:two-component system chemotaxis response regulator CheB
MKKILIADDSALMRKTLCDIITSQQTENIEIDTCMDGDNACRKIIENRPDLAIIDLYLPKMNASEIVAQMQEYDTMVPMILIGSSVIEDTDAGSLVAGMNEITYVVRPFRIFGEQSVAFGETILREADALMRRTGKKQISERPTTISTPVAASRTPATSPGTSSSQPS